RAPAPTSRHRDSGRRATHLLAHTHTVALAGVAVAVRVRVGLDGSTDAGQPADRLGGVTRHAGPNTVRVAAEAVGAVRARAITVGGAGLAILLLASSEDAHIRSGTGVGRIVVRPARDGRAGPSHGAHLARAARSHTAADVVDTVRAHTFRVGVARRTILL